MHLSSVKEHAENKQRPIYAVPRRSIMQLLSDSGSRILAAKDGFWYEQKTSWMHVRTKIAHQSSIMMPYGELTQHVSFVFKDFPSDLLERFEQTLRGRTNQQRSMAWIFWSEENGFEFVENIGDHLGAIKNAYKENFGQLINKKFLVMELRFGANVIGTDPILLEYLSGGGYFLSQYMKNKDGEMVRLVDLRVEKMVFPIADVIEQMAEQAHVGKRDLAKLNSLQ